MFVAWVQIKSTHVNDNEVDARPGQQTSSSRQPPRLDASWLFKKKASARVVLEVAYQDGEHEELDPLIGLRLDQQRIALEVAEVAKSREHRTRRRKDDQHRLLVSNHRKDKVVAVVRSNTPPWERP